MIVNDLKKSILKYAITGKLTSKLPGDSSISETLNKIKREKEKLYNSKLITKQQFVVEENKEQYKLEIPDDWELTQIGNLGYVVGGGTPRTEISEYWGNDYSWITPKDMKNFSTKFVDSGERSITKLGLQNSSAQLIPAGSILCSSRAPIGYLGISKNELTTNQGFKTLVPLCGIDPEYVYYYLTARVDDLKKAGDGTTFSEISGSDLSKFYIAIPSIEEQHRIVIKIEELFEKLNEIEPIELELNNLKTNFPNNFKTSIIQSACYGNLSTQIANENASFIVKKIEEVRGHAIKTNFNSTPFVIPNNWVWIKFDDLVDFNIGKTPPRADSSYWGNDYSWLSISDMIEDGYVNETKEGISNKACNDIFKKNISPVGTLIMSFKLTVGRCSILNIDAFHNEGIISIYPKYENVILKKYLMKVLPYLTKYGDKKGAIKGNTLNSKSLKELMIPLPPIEEQQRIVDKIEELLPLLNDIENLVIE